MSAGAVAGAAAKRAERLLVAHFKNSEAVSPTSACALPELQWMGKRVLSRLIQVGAIHEVKSGYYLDEGVYDAYSAGRHRMVKRILISVVGVAVFVVSLVIWLTTRQ